MLVRYVIDAYSWRAAYLVLAAIIGVHRAAAGLPVDARVAARARAATGWRPTRRTVRQRQRRATSGLELTGILRRREFWVTRERADRACRLRCIGLLRPLVPMLVDRGMSACDRRERLRPSKASR